MAVENATLLANETLNQTSTVVSLPAPLEYALEVGAPRIKDLLLAPAQHPDMLWTLAPMLIALVLMQIYFGRNKEETLGWNTAFGNSIALIFISASLLRQLYILSGDIEVVGFLNAALAFHEPKVLIIVFLFGYGLFLALLSFFHWIPEKIAFFLMSGIAINSTAYVVIVLVNSDNIPLDTHTLAAGVVVFLLVYAVSVILRSVIPQSRLSRIRRLQRLRAMLDAQEDLVRNRARNTRIDFLRSRLEEKQAKLHVRSAAVSSKIKELENS